MNRTFTLRLTSVHFAWFTLAIGVLNLVTDSIFAYIGGTPSWEALISTDVWVLFLILWVLSLEKLQEIGDGPAR